MSAELARPCRCLKFRDVQLTALERSGRVALPETADRIAGRPKPAGDIECSYHYRSESQVEAAGKDPHTVKDPPGKEASGIVRLPS